MKTTELELHMVNSFLSGLLEEPIPTVNPINISDQKNIILTPQEEPVVLERLQQKATPLSKNTLNLPKNLLFHLTPETYSRLGCQRPTIGQFVRYIGHHTFARNAGKDRNFSIELNPVEWLNSAETNQDGYVVKILNEFVFCKWYVRPQFIFSNISVNFKNLIVL